MTLKAQAIDCKEEKVRKNWLKAALSYFIFYPMILITLVHVFSGADRSSFGIFVFLLLAQSVIGLITFGILWRFAYVKLGTAWLTWSLIVSPFQFCKSFIMEVKEGLNSLSAMGILFSLCVFIWWYVASIRLRKINKKMRAQKNTV